MAMAGFLYLSCVSRVGRISNYREAIAGAEMQKIFWRGAGSIPGARSAKSSCCLGKRQASRGRAKRGKGINQSDEKRRRRKEKRTKKDGHFVSSVIQTDGNLTGKDGPAGVISNCWPRICPSVR